VNHLDAHAELCFLYFVQSQWFQAKPTGWAGALLQLGTINSLKLPPSLPIKCPDQLTLHGLLGERPSLLGHQKGADVESVCGKTLGGKLGKMGRRVWVEDGRAFGHIIGGEVGDAIAKERMHD
jgi:hypothetical protein